MLKLDYGPGKNGAQGRKALEPVQALARIWALRIMTEMGRLEDPGLQYADTLRQTGLMDCDTSRGEVFKVLNSGVRIRQQLARLTSNCPPMKCPLSDNMSLLGKQFDLTVPEGAAMACMSVFWGISWFQDFVRGVVRDGGLPDQSHCFAAATGLSPYVLQQAMSPGGRLLRLGLLVPRTPEARDNPCDLRLPFMLSSTILARRLGDDYIEQQSVRAVPEPECAMTDFDLESPSLRLISQALRAFGSENSGNGQILLHGHPGGGKTQFVRTLAHHLGLCLKEIPESAHDAIALNPTDRLQRFVLAQSLLEDRPETMLIFDEADQVLAWPAQAAGRDLES